MIGRGGQMQESKIFAMARKCRSEWMIWGVSICCIMVVKRRLGNWLQVERGKKWSFSCCATLGVFSSDNILQAILSFWSTVNRLSFPLVFTLLIFTNLDRGKQSPRGFLVVRENRINLKIFLKYGSQGHKSCSCFRSFRYAYLSMQHIHDFRIHHL